MKIPYTTSTPDPEVATVLEVGKKYGIDEAMIIHTSKVEVKEWVALRYRYGCLNGGKIKCNAPGTATPEEMRNVMREYKRALLIAAKTKDSEAQFKFRKALVEMERALFLKDNYKAFAILPDCCLAGKPLDVDDSVPERPTIDCSGIDMLSLVRKYKKSIQTVKDLEKSSESYGLILLD